MANTKKMNTNNKPPSTNNKRQPKQIKKTPIKNNNSSNNLKDKPNIRFENKSVAQDKNGKYRQIYAIIFLALSILIFFIAIIPGENIWLYTHNFIMGLFGICTYLIPPIFFYITFVLATERPIEYIKPVIVIIAIMLSLISAAIYIFTVPEYEKYNVIDEFVRIYKSGSELKSAGIYSFLGILSIWIIGRTGSKIVILILLFVFTMMITGVTLPQLFRLIKKPFITIANNAKNRSEKIEYRANNNNKNNLTKHNILPQNVPKQQAPDIVKEKIKDKSSFHKSKYQKFASQEKIQQKPKSIIPFLDVPVENTNADELKDRSFQPEKQSIDNNNTTFEMPVLENIIVKTIEDTTETNSSDLEYENIYSNSQDEIKAKKSNNTTKNKKTGNTKFNDIDKDNLEDLSSLLVDKVVDDDTHTDINEFEADISKKINAYRLPPINLLEKSISPNNDDVAAELNTNGQLLVDTLNSFGVSTRIVNISRGPSVTRYELQPAAGVKISKITSLSDDIAMNLAAIGVRIEAPIPGKSAVGIEVPNKIKSIVKIRELIDNNDFKNAASKLTVALGRDIAGSASYTDLANMPHLLIAGSTGSGKSVCINTILISLLYKSTPDEVKILMIDPKVVELGIYNGIPHLLVPVVTDPKKAAGALNWAVSEMLDRYSRFAENNVRDLKGYNKKVEEYNSAIDNESIIEMSLFNDNAENKKSKPKMQKLPQIVIVIDELADLMMAAPNEVEDSICRLAQMARAAGMHLIIATQRPSVDVITGIIKANIPSRIAFAVSSQVDSRTILDGAGAEKLLGRGDMLFSPIGSSKPKRIQGCFVNDNEIENVIKFIKKSQKGEYDKNVIDEIEKNTVSDKSTKVNEDTDYDPMIEEAIKCVVDAGQASTSYLQRKLHLGYARAGRLIDEMEEMGIVGPHEGAKPRQVLITYQQWLERNINNSEPDNESNE